MTQPITVQYALGGSLQRYTNIPPVNPDPGDPTDPGAPGGSGGRIVLGGTAVAGIGGGGGGTGGGTATIFGYNFNNQDNPEQTIAGRKAKFGGRNPCPRVYTGSTGHPTTFTAGVADEKRVCWSFKKDQDGPLQTTAYLASVAARDDRYIPWLESIPAGWEVFWCYHHEANSASGFEVPVADWRNTYTRMLEAKAQASLKAGVTVHVTSNLMAYQVDTGIWTDQWVPDCDILTWDMYGNPGQNTPQSGTNKYGTANAGGYGSQYPLPAARMDAMFRVTQRTGHAASWGVLEISSPLRNWDVGERGRALWTQDVLDYFQAGGGMTGGKPPKIVLMWEAPSGVNWNQAHGFNWDPTPAKSPVPGTIAQSQTKIDNSLLWDVWRPYIVGTPRRG